MSQNYFEDVIEHMEKYEIGISSCKNKNILKLQKNDLQTINHSILSKEAQPLKCNFHARRQGWLMTLNLETYKTLDYKIPNYLNLWYGDDWIWSQFALNNLKMGVYKNRYSIHVKSATIVSNNMQSIIDEDNQNLQSFGQWYKKASPLIHIRTRIFSRYV